MTYHVCTPFSRPQNISKLVRNLNRERAGHDDIIWHPLAHRATRFPRLPWIQPFYVTYPKDWLVTGACCYWKMNQFISAGLIEDDYYCVLCDDDQYGHGFFAEIRRHSAPVVVPSMYEPRHGLLLACSENMRVSRCGFQQMVIRGWMLKGYHYSNSPQADGQLLERISGNIDCTFAHSALVLANSI